MNSITAVSSVILGISDIMVLRYIALDARARASANRFTKSRWPARTVRSR